MSKLLCLDDSYLRECSAGVVSASRRGVVLDQTVFYPRGGGQPSDTGLIIGPDGTSFRVSGVSKKDGQVVHELETDAPFKGGDQVRCVIDWGRRYRLMRMHTAAHVLAAFMHSELGILISGNQLDETQSRFDFNMSRSEKNDREHARERIVVRDMNEFDRGKFELVVGKANGALARGGELKAYSLPREEAMKIPGVVKLAGALPPSISVLRIVEIPGVDVQADGGTHVRNLSEVGTIQIIKLDNKGKDNRRIYFSLLK